MEKNKSLTPAEPHMGLQQTIAVDQIHITPATLQRVNVGDVESFSRMLRNRDFTGEIQGLVWNEERISVLSNLPNLMLQFYPEVNPGVKIFLQKKDTRRRDVFGQPESPIVWSGEFEPVQFTKQNLIKFLQQYSSGLPPEMLKSIKNTKIQERHSEEDELISLDGDATRTVIEESMSTSVPKRFSILMPLIYRLDGTELISATLDFEVSVTRKKDEYDRKTNQNIFELRCLNGRKALQGMMQQIIEQLPPELPVYYGAKAVELPGRN